MSRDRRRLIAWGVSAVCKLSGCSALLMMGWMTLAVLLGFALNPMGIFDSLSRRGRVVGAVNGAFLLGSLTVFAPAFGWMVPVVVPAVCCGVSAALTVWLEVTEFIPDWKRKRREWMAWKQECGAEYREWRRKHGRFQCENTGFQSENSGFHTENRGFQSENFPLFSGVFTDFPVVAQEMDEIFRESRGRGET